MNKEQYQAERERLLALIASTKGLRTKDGVLKLSLYNQIAQLDSANK